MLRDFLCPPDFNVIRNCIQKVCTVFHYVMCRRLVWKVMICSAIHKAPVQRSAGGWNDPQTSFPIDGFTAFSEIVPGNAGNGSAGGFVNRAVTGRARLI